MNTLILGSRIFAPIEMVDREIAALPPDTAITAYGNSDVCKRAVLAGESRGMEARNVTLEPSRASLIAAAKQPGATVLLFCCTDPRTKVLTEGMSQIAALLSAEGIVARRIDSPLPGRVCEAISKLRQSVDKSLAIAQPVRRQVMVTRTLRLVTDALMLRDDYERKLEAAGIHLMLGDEQADSRWITWLGAYEAITDATEDAKSVLVERRAA